MSSPGAERERIAAELAGIGELRFAVLFGSQRSGRPRPDSDWDVGIYLDPACEARERERRIAEGRFGRP